MCTDAHATNHTAMAACAIRAHTFFVCRVHQQPQKSHVGVVRALGWHVGAGKCAQLSIQRWTLLVAEQAAEAQRQAVEEKTLEARFIQLPMRAIIPMVGSRSHSSRCLCALGIFITS